MWVERLIGILVFWMVVTLALAAFSHLVPGSAGQFLSTQMRMLDSLRPHLLIIVLGLGVGLLLLGEWRFAVASLAGVVVVLGMLVADYAQRIAPRAAQGDLSVLWFNMLETNDIPTEDLAKALIAADVDVIFLAESLPAAGLPTLLADTHPYQLGCDETDKCGIMMMSRLPLEHARIRDLPSGQSRFIRVVVALEGRKPVHLIAIHMVKPWYAGFADTERERLDAALNAREVPPTILVGDFNAAPWSRRIRRLERKFEFRHTPLPASTWPVGAGGLGVPIDHVLLRGGVALAGSQTWGRELGSNHLGLRAEIALPRP